MDHTNDRDAHSRATADDRDSRLRLDSWKEIATYLRRSVRTVQRWEALGLPVRRHEHAAGASVYAYGAELDHWWATQRPVDPPIDSITQASADNPTGTPRLAVLPLLDLSPEPALHFADGFLDELITRLATSRDISVVSRTSVMQVQRLHAPSPWRIGALLSVSLVIEGSIQRLDHHVVVTVRLVRPTAAGEVIWGQQYRCLHSDLSATQADIAQDIMRHAARRLGPAQASADSP